MNDAAFSAIEEAWELTIKARALCPFTGELAVGTSGYLSPPWYRARGATYFVNLAEPLSSTDAAELREVGSFINRSFIISMAAILEDHGVIPYGKSPNTLLEGGGHAQLVKLLRHRFAHGEWEYDPADRMHRSVRSLMEELLPDGASRGPGFVTSIDGVLEPLKDGVLAYIKSST
jgi:hypothetical protein